jgi:hypothetical protein
VFWRTSTASHIRSHGETSSGDYPGFYLKIFIDWFKAIALSMSYKEKVPWGVYAHGGFLVAFVIALVLGIKAL